MEGFRNLNAGNLLETQLSLIVLEGEPDIFIPRMNTALWLL